MHIRPKVSLWKYWGNDVLHRILGVLFGLVMVYCPANADSAHEAFYTQFKGLCGKAFSGSVVKDDQADPRFGGKHIILHVRDCSDTEIRMPMHVGDDHSRTFILRLMGEGLEFRHDHRHEDGSPDAVTLYGGVTIAAGSSDRQDFPADDKTKVLFVSNGLDVSVNNVWTISIIPNQTVTYALNRPNREFAISFDLTKEVQNPPAAWGY